MCTTNVPTDVPTYVPTNVPTSVTTLPTNISLHLSLYLLVPTRVLTIRPSKLTINTLTNGMSGIAAVAKDIVVHYESIVTNQRIS